jgi:hypothetical protein
MPTHNCAGAAVFQERVERDRSGLFPLWNERAPVRPKQLALARSFPNQDVEPTPDSAGADREVELFGRRVEPTVNDEHIVV